MNVYSFDPVTMEFIVATTAFESPLEPGVFHYPTNTTKIAPPAFDVDTQICEFNGKKWVVRGRPEPETPPAPTQEEVVADLMSARTGRLYQTDWLVVRHQEESLSGVEPTLTPDNLKALLVYRQALRDLPGKSDFPDCGTPAMPSFIG